MAETYAQRKSAVRAQARAVRKTLRTVDSQVELLQRNVARLNNRKTLITPESLISISDQTTELNRRLDAYDTALANLAQVSASYL
jgi:hypothetical protein